MQKDVSASETIKADTFFPRIWRQGRNYSTIVGWLLYRAFTGRQWQLAIAVVLSLLHLSTQVAAIYVVYWYGKQMEQTGLVTVPFLDINVNLKDDPQWLWAIVAVSTACFVISAALLYFSRKVILDMVEKYFARSSEQLVLLSLRVPDPRVPFASISSWITDSEASLRDAAAAVDRDQLRQCHHRRRWRLGCRLLPLPHRPASYASDHLLGPLGRVVPLSDYAAGGAKRQGPGEDASGNAAEVRKLNEDPTVEQTATSLETVDEVARSLMMRRRVLTELVFAMEIGVTILLGVVIYYMASQALAGREQWAIFIAYIGALRMTLNGVTLAIRAFANVSRYYPQIVRYYLFIKDMQKIDKTPLAEVRRGDKVFLGALPNGQDVVVEAGDRLATLSLVRLLREPMFAVVGAKLVRSGEPVASAAIDPANIRKTPAGITIVSGNKLLREEERAALALDELKDKVTMIFYQVNDRDRVGSFGETHVLTTEDGELRRFAVLGTEESDAVLKEFTLKATKTATKAGLAEDDEEEDDI